MDKKALNTMLPPTVFKITTTGKGQMGASPIDSHVNKLDCTSKVNLITIWKPKCHFILFQSNSTMLNWAKQTLTLEISPVLV